MKNLSKAILIITLFTFTACADTTQTATSSASPNILGYANADDLGVCSGLGFQKTEDLNSCVRARMLTKSAYYKNQMGYNKVGNGQLVRN
jgi:hypothetical protein